MIQSPQSPQSPNSPQSHQRRQSHQSPQSHQLKLDYNEQKILIIFVKVEYI